MSRSKQDTSGKKSKVYALDGAIQRLIIYVCIPTDRTLPIFVRTIYDGQVGEYGYPQNHDGTPDGICKKVMGICYYLVENYPLAESYILVTPCKDICNTIWLLYQHKQNYRPREGMDHELYLIFKEFYEKVKNKPCYTFYDPVAKFMSPVFMPPKDYILHPLTAEEKGKIVEYYSHFNFGTIDMNKLL